ncbi:signal peptidase I [Nitratifractor sp.]
MKRRFGKYLLLSVLCVAVLSFVRPYRVSDISMNYSLMDGDIVWVENLTAGIHVPSWSFYIDRHLWDREKGIHRGDILAFRHPLDRRLYLKRCVALPGDRVFEQAKDLYLQIGGDSEATRRYASKRGIEAVRKKGEWWLKNPYAHFYAVVHDPGVVGPRELIDFPVTRIPPHRYFFMGDYRDNSTDSRFFGPVPYDYIYYKVFFVWQRARSMETLAKIRHYDEKHPLVIRKKY